MDEAVFLVVDYEGVCRLCLQARGALSELFANENNESNENGESASSAAPGEEPTPPLAVQIRTLTDVHMSENDNLPKKICHKCRYIVETCYELRTTVIRSNRLLLGSVEADDLINEVTQVYKKNEDEMDFYADGEFSDAVDDSADNYDDKAFPRDETDSTDGRAQFYRSGEIVEESGSAVESHSENGNLIVECKTETPESFDEKSNSERKDYTSSRDVTLDEVKFDVSESSQMQLLPYISDDAGSDGPSPKRKEGGGDRPYRPHHTCQLCLDTFSERAALISHVSEHYKDSNLIPYVNATKPFACQECHHTFMLKVDLITHHRKHLDINPYMCKVQGCNFDIRSREALRHHMYTHALKKYVCNECGARYRRKVEILRHKVRHLDEGRQFRCGLCWVICKNRLSLKAHLKNHEIGRRFKCEFPGCPKAFFSNSDLVIHSRSHSNDKCFKCRLCVCAYTSQSQLNRHLRRHDKPGPTKCDKCSEVFEDYGSFCNHRIATHGEWQPHRCKGCNQGYQSEQQLEKHLNRCEIAQRMKELGSDNLTMIIEEKVTSTYID